MKKLALLMTTGVLLVSLASAALLPSATHAASKGQIMFILDASSSMLAKDGSSSTRIAKAKAALSQVIDSVPADTAIGLRVYGSKVPDTNKAEGCQDSKLYSAPATNNAANIKTAIAGIEAKGWTLMGKSLQDVQSDFTGSGPKTVILISDGVDTCSPPSACEIAKNLSAGGVDIKVNTIGLLVNDEGRSQLTCIARNSGGGYFDINDLNKLQSTLASLTAREVSLFTAAGTPIRGSLRIEEAPLLLPDTFYTDNLTLPQELYYAVDALPNQKITVTVKGVNRNTELGRTDYLHVTGFMQDTAKKLRSLRGSEAFGKSDVTTAVFEIDTAKEKLTKPERLAIQVATSKTKLDGTVLPLEISVTTEGGDAPNNAVSEAAAKTGRNDTALSPIAIVLMTLGAVVLLALLAYALKKFVLDPRKAASSAEGPTSTTPAVDNTSSTVVSPGQSVSPSDTDGSDRQ